VKPPAELAAQRMLTDQFIAADYVDLILHTRVKADTGPNKGSLVDGADRASQRFRLIPQNISPNSGARYDATVQSTAAFMFVLMGKWDAVMELYDWWENEHGQVLQIDTMMPDNGYERKGMVNIYKRAK